MSGVQLLPSSNLIIPVPLEIEGIDADVHVEEEIDSTDPRYADYIRCVSDHDSGDVRRSEPSARRVRTLHESSD